VPHINVLSEKKASITSALDEILDVAKELQTGSQNISNKIESPLRSFVVVCPFRIVAH
jgi:hypothetical protein